MEIKPRGFQKMRTPLGVRTIVAQKFIRGQGLDWQYQVVYDDEIHLPECKRNKFRLLCQQKAHHTEQLNHDGTPLQGHLFRPEPLQGHFASREALEAFVQYGTRP